MSENQTSCGCNCSGKEKGCNPGQTGSNHFNSKWISGVNPTPIGLVPRVSTRLSGSDILGSWKARWGIGRMNYTIAPGLYSVGNPGSDSIVLVSANYKMSFDRLRKELTGIDAWILVIDTKGINVWCAAGKGTFGTAEIVKRILQVKLAGLVNHRNLILPQLGAPGVSAHEVLKQSGFKVLYGPVRAKDLPTFLQANNNCSPEMRRVHFSLWDRLCLVPLELTAVLIPAFIWFVILFGLGLIGNWNTSLIKLLEKAFIGFIPFLGAILAGTLVVPIFLPFIPGRSFAWKGWLMGLLWTAVYVWIFFSAITWMQIVICFLLVPAIASYLALNFTGSSTYTSLSGVVKEMSFALPAIMISTGLGVVLFITNLFLKL